MAALRGWLHMNEKSYRGDRRRICRIGLMQISETEGLEQPISILHVPTSIGITRYAAIRRIQQRSRAL